jgi:hypothetical protein
VELGDEDHRDRRVDAAEAPEPRGVGPEHGEIGEICLGQVRTSALRDTT